jgi:hypothetical protein
MTIQHSAGKPVGNGTALASIKLGPFHCGHRGAWSMTIDYIELICGPIPQFAILCQEIW